MHASTCTETQRHECVRLGVHRLHSCPPQAPLKRAPSSAATFVAHLHTHAYIRICSHSLSMRFLTSFNTLYSLPPRPCKRHLTSSNSRTRARRRHHRGGNGACRRDSSIGYWAAKYLRARCCCCRCRRRRRHSADTFDCAGSILEGCRCAWAGM